MFEVKASISAIFQIYVMKQFFLTLFQKADSLLEHDPSTQNRSAPSRITTSILFLASLFCIVYYFVTRII